MTGRGGGRRGALGRRACDPLGRWHVLIGHLHIWLDPVGAGTGVLRLLVRGLYQTSTQRSREKRGIEDRRWGRATGVRERNRQYVEV